MELLAKSKTCHHTVGPLQNLSNDYCKSYAVAANRLFKSNEPDKT